MWYMGATRYPATSPNRSNKMARTTRRHRIRGNALVQRGTDPLNRSSVAVFNVLPLSGHAHLNPMVFYFWNDGHVSICANDSARADMVTTVAALRNLVDRAENIIPTLSEPDFSPRTLLSDVQEDR
jgi:hypothetical protein